ncbi:MAG: DUF4426 domain-containing protein [Gammaproteobacteria bacterium]|jgi:hypothetical protein|nr:DUF4426 domain-containing protein [Gammaproteobacteria bacterium]
MSLFRALLITLMVCVSSLAGSLTHAEQLLETRDYQIHYNAFNTMLVTPEIAQALGFTRARNRALVNISVLDSNDNKPLMAMVAGQRKNLVGQIYPLEFQQIVEPGAIYYIAELRFSEAEMWQFDIRIQPDPHAPAIPLKFSQTFYIEQ